MNTPILLITFNRPVHVQRVLAEIRKQQPAQLFVFQDGPRDWEDGYEKVKLNDSRVVRGDDYNKIIEVRNVIDKLVDWPCELHTLYQVKNLGCGAGPVTGINWFFNNVEMGIIIEDDAIPHYDFFEYCSILLKKYREDKEVWAIGSMNIDKKKYGDGSYYFSMMNRCLCAWATWKRSWKYFDYYLRDVSLKNLDNSLKRYGCKLRMREYWLERLTEIQKDALHNSSWDQQFLMLIWLNFGKGIMPNVNLCSNIGFDEYGTHTTNSNNIASNVVTRNILPIIHPSSNSICKDADFKYHKLYFEPYNYGWSGVKRLIYRINKRIKRFCGFKGSWRNKLFEV